MSGVRDAYEIVPYREEHRAGVLALRELSPGISPAWSAAHLRWQQEENPCFESHLIYLALFRRRVVGMRALQPAEWTAGGDPRIRFRGPCFVGTVIAPEHRSRGLFARLTGFAETDLASRGIPYAFNLSASATTYVGSLAAGWRAIGPLGSAFRHPRIRGQKPWTRGLRVVLRLASRARSLGRDVHVSTDARPAEMARLAAPAPGDGRIRHVRDEAYFRWRFRDPSSRYRFVYLERAGRLAGYVALHRRAPPLSWSPLVLADWERDESLAWSELLGAAVRYAELKQHPLAAWLAAFPEPARDWLRRSGFEDHPPPGPFAQSRPTLLAQRLGPADTSSVGSDAEWQIAGRRVLDPASWDLRPLCSDSY